MGRGMTIGSKVKGMGKECRRKQGRWHMYERIK
jgi:hypothetical protein